MFHAGEIIPQPELDARLNRARRLLAVFCPEAEGLMVFNRVNIYYLTGTFGNGVFWLPREGRPVLFARKGAERAAIESPSTHTVAFTSYGELLPILSEHNGPPAAIAVEKGALSWSLSELLQKKLPGIRFVAGDVVLQRARSVKTVWELDKLRLAGARHREAMETILPEKIRPGMTEREIAHTVWNVYFSLGHCGIMRMASFGEEIFLGHVAVGENGYHPSHYNGPLGLMGEHPATPYMGNAGTVWKKNSLLCVDTGFSLEGYNTDKTQVYFSGRQEDIPAPVAKAQEACAAIEAAVAAECAPGVLPSALYQLGLDMAAKAGFAEGFMGMGGNRVPFLGHGIGLAVDEWPVMARKFDEPLEEGMVMAIEPKITLPGYGMPGTENTYLVTKQGGVRLTGGPGRLINVP